MSKKFFKLNNTTKTLGKIFPALLICTPAVAFSAIIDQSTSVPQDFSADAEYVINQDVTISSADSEAAVSVSGFKVNNATNNGNISGTGNGLNINTGVQSVVINNGIGATISSTTANAVNIKSLRGDFNNSGSIIGAENGMFVSKGSSALNITNTSNGMIKGKTGLSTQAGIGINNYGSIIGTNGDAITADYGNTKVINSCTVQGTDNGISSKDTANLDILNSGTISGETNAIMFASSEINTLLLDTGSTLIGDVISTNSKGNTLTLIGTGTEDSNFIGLNEGDGFASVTMNGESWALSGNIDIIGSGDSLLVETGALTLAGDVSNTGNTRVAKDASLQLGDGEKTATLSGGLTNNGTVIFNQGSDFTFATDMTGSGNVEKVDSNTLTLTGKNS